MSQDTNKSNLECPICLDPISKFDNSYALTNPCNHFYHETCILSWTNISASTCPQCRDEIKSINILNKSKIIPIKHKEADKLLNMIDNNNIGDNHTNNNNSITTTLSTEGLVNVLISTSNDRSRSNRSLYERMMQANSSNSLSSNISIFRRSNNIIRSSTSNENQNHLSNQQCCICDNSVFLNQVIICPQCSALYHRSCSDELNCPLCEEWIDDILSPCIENNKTRKKKINKHGLKNKFDDSNYYVELVNELQRRNKSNENEHEHENLDLNSNIENNQEEEQAWNALNQIQESSKNTANLEQSNNKIIPSIETEPKLKRPKRSISKSFETPTKQIKLTESALASFDSKFNNTNNNKNNIHNKKIEIKDNKDKYHIRSIKPTNLKSKELSFTQKLLIQRLILKPRLNSNLTSKLSFDSYTDLNKTLSRKLYDYIKNSTLAISSMNAVIELAEREGFLPFNNRKCVDKFHNKLMDNSIVSKFTNCKWDNRTDNNKFNIQIDEIVNNEIEKWLNNSL
jgi:hypothetical protein